MLEGSLDPKVSPQLKWRGGCRGWKVGGGTTSLSQPRKCRNFIRGVLRAQWTDSLRTGNVAQQIFRSFKIRFRQKPESIQSCHNLVLNAVKFEKFDIFVEK